MKAVFAVLIISILIAAAMVLAASIEMLAAGPIIPGLEVLHPSGIPHAVGGAFGLLIAAAAVVFALMVTTIALAGAFLAVVFAFVLTGLILLAVALPFLLPLIIPLAAILLVLFFAGRTGRSRPV